jgi:hypothetical protein
MKKKENYVKNKNKIYLENFKKKKFINQKLSIQELN